MAFHRLRTAFMLSPSNSSSTGVVHVVLSVACVSLAMPGSFPPVRITTNTSGQSAMLLSIVPHNERYPFPCSLIPWGSCSLALFSVHCTLFAAPSDTSLTCILAVCPYPLWSFFIRRSCIFFPPVILRVAPFILSIPCCLTWSLPCVGVGAAFDGLSLVTFLAYAFDEVYLYKIKTTILRIRWSE
ncbi:hypothetical protein BDN67DRAFT_740220 [Paxillus ammoniavirescens]|nr:hypothetical protein BDN67DRAFT_740220 [Paxillus ammoniavirescens]